MDQVECVHENVRGLGEYILSSRLFICCCHIFYYFYDPLLLYPSFHIPCPYFVLVQHNRATNTPKQCVPEVSDNGLDRLAHTSSCSILSHGIALSSSSFSLTFSANILFLFFSFLLLAILSFSCFFKVEIFSYKSIESARHTTLVGFKNYECVCLYVCQMH